ncbi:MAG TPA: histidine kinase [Sunxiuqinia sp.]|nr:histidine kinase [Sunxiuqinia sp.]
MDQSTKRKYFLIELLLGLLLINGLHFLIKKYDSSFEGIWDYGTRGIFFHLFFVLMGLVFWWMGRWLSEKIQSSSFKSLKRQFQIVLGTVIFLTYGLFVSVSYNEVYYFLFYQITNQEYIWKEHQLFDPDFSLIIFIFYFFVAAVTLLIHYFGNWREAQLMAERLKKENIQSKFEVLKNQIDPHFFFNSLSVLTSLVYKDANLSAEYITQLSKMYRYILEGKNQSLVSIGDELNFLSSYIFLIKVRYNENICFEIEIAEDLRNKIYLPKNSLQMLVENAIKHNKFGNGEPLIVRIFAGDGYIQVVNNKNRRELIEYSSKIGLENIKKRYELIGNYELLIEETDESFTVKLPKLTSSEAKHFDI